MISIEFLVTSLVVVLIPGTGVIYTVSTGLAQGRKASVFAALGCTIGIVPHTFRKLVIESHAVQRWLRYGFAATFAGLGGKLALTEK